MAQHRQYIIPKDLFARAQKPVGTLPVEFDGTWQGDAIVVPAIPMFLYSVTPEVDERIDSGELEPRIRVEATGDVTTSGVEEIRFLALDISVPR